MGSVGAILAPDILPVESVSGCGTTWRAWHDGHHIVNVSALASCRAASHKHASLRRGSKQRWGKIEKVFGHCWDAKGGADHEHSHAIARLARRGAHPHPLLDLFRSRPLRGRAGAHLPGADLDVPMPGSRAAKPQQLRRLESGRHAGGGDPRCRRRRPCLREPLRPSRFALVSQGARGGTRNRLRLPQLDV